MSRLSTTELDQDAVPDAVPSTSSVEPVDDPQDGGKQMEEVTKQLKSTDITETPSEVDISILYHEDDIQLADTFCKHLMKDIPVKEPIKVKRYDEIMSTGSEFTGIEQAFKSSTYVFIYMTEKYVNDTLIQHKGESCLMEAIENPTKKWSVVPVFTEKPNTTFKVPFCLKGLIGVKYYINDVYYREHVARMIEEKRNVRPGGNGKLIFLSYHRGVEEKVKELKQNLKMAGYESFMDIEQLGRDDKKINNDDLRAAQVVICCITKEYLKSENCNREVNVSEHLGKLIIPLLMEEMKWPPEGDMGRIFSKYLEITFFQSPVEESNDQRYWSQSKFQELLRTLYALVPQDKTLVQPVYENWWLPLQGDMKIPNSSKQSANKTQTGENTTPELFLSYKWDQQDQVKALYKRLVGLGYNVWMDIFKMGGGDSLYGEIYRGIRGCKLVIACITPKYALSPTCQREISLADALEKPIIPLLLEEISWPPEGPMSMVFTGKIYVNMYRDPEVQKSWTGSTFDGVIDKVQEECTKNK